MPKRKKLSKRGHGEGSAFQRSDGRWQGAVTIGTTPEGRQRRKTVYGTSQAEVLAKIGEIKKQLLTGTFAATDLTVKDYLERWVSEKSRTVKPRTEDLYRDWIQNQINPRIGSVKLAKLTPIQVQAMVSEVADKVGVSTANKTRKTLFGALKQAVRWNLVPRNVCDAVAPLKETSKKMVLWTPEQVVKFLDTARPNRYYAAFYLLIVTGLRRGEVLGLKWSDLKENRLYIQRSFVQTFKGTAWSTPKTERGNRYVTLPEDALRVLEQHHKLIDAERLAFGDTWADPDLIFPSEIGTPVTPTFFQGVWKRLQTRAGVPTARLHDMRHLHVSLLIKKGFDPRTVADRVGHTDPAFTLRKYSHMFEEHRQVAAINLAELLGSPTPPHEQN